MINKLKDILKSFPLKEKNLWYFFIIFFALGLVAVNWTRIYWLFNQRAVYGELKTIVRREPSPLMESPESEISPKETPVLPGESTDRENSIEIPKINIIAPLISPENDSEESFQASLKKGVMHYPDSVFPGQKGTTIILGHSAPVNWPKIDYDWIFNEISQLELGDEIWLYFNQRKYTYLVREGKVLDRGAAIPLEWLSDSQPSLVLLSCWPPGKDYKRFGVSAILEK